MKKVVFTKDAPAAIGPYSQGIIVGDLVFTSGQLPVDPKSGEIPETIEAQARQSLENVKAILEEAGSGMENIVKTTVFLADMNDFAAVNEVYASFFESDYPCRSAVQIARLPKDAGIEIEAIATRN